VYWTTIDPQLIEALGKGTYRDLGGLPTGNTGEWLEFGELDIAAFAAGQARIQVATSLHGTEGGLPEIKFTSEEAVNLYVHYRYSILMPERF
jgi:hypothetical protein